MNGSGRRNKGHNGEREFAKKLSEALGRPVQRNIDQVRLGGADIVEVPPFAIEVKRQEQLSVNAWRKQAIAQTTRDNPIAVLVFKQNRQPWRVQLDGRWIFKKKIARLSPGVEWVEVSLDWFIRFAISSSID